MILVAVSRSGLETVFSLPQILDPDPDSHLGVAKALKVDPDSGFCWTQIQDSAGFRFCKLDSDSVKWIQIHDLR